MSSIEIKGSKVISIELPTSARKHLDASIDEVSFSIWNSVILREVQQKWIVSIAALFAFF